MGGHLADHGFGLLLAFTRRIADALRLGTDAWALREAMRRVELELEGLVMGIVGFGGTGRAMVRRAQAFGMPCLAVDEMEVPGGDGVDEVWPASRLTELLGASDVVAICCPLTEATTKLFDAAAFAAMKPGAILVNVTRGEVVDGDALVRALESGRSAAPPRCDGEPLPARHPLYHFDSRGTADTAAPLHRARRNIDRSENLRSYCAARAVGVVDKQAAD